MLNEENRGFQEEHMLDIPVIPRAPKSTHEPYEAQITPIRVRTQTEFQDPCDTDGEKSVAWDLAFPYVADYIDAIGQAGKESEAIFLMGMCRTLASNGAPITEITNTAHEFLSLFKEAVDVFYDLYYRPHPDVRFLGNSAVAAIARVHSA